MNKLLLDIIETATQEVRLALLQKDLLKSAEDICVQCNVAVSERFYEDVLEEWRESVALLCREASKTDVESVWIAFCDGYHGLTVRMADEFIDVLKPLMAAKFIS